MLVVESLIHTLIARSRLSLRDAIELLDVAIDAQTALDADRAPIRGPSSQTLDLLYTIRASLRIDDDGAESTDRDR